MKDEQQFHNALNLVLQGYTVPYWIDSNANSNHQHPAAAKRLRDVIEIYCYGYVYISFLVGNDGWTNDFNRICAERNVQFMPEYAIKQAKF